MLWRFSKVYFPSVHVTENVMGRIPQRPNPPLPSLERSRRLGEVKYKGMFSCYQVESRDNASAFYCFDIKMSLLVSVVKKEPEDFRNILARGQVL